MYITEDGYRLIRARLDSLTLDCQVAAKAKTKDSAVRQALVVGNRIEDVKKLLDDQVYLGPPDGAA